MFTSCYQNIFDINQCKLKMKKLILFAGISVFAISAYAQTGTSSNEQGTTVSSTARESTLEGKEKGQAISEIAESKSMSHRQDDLNSDGKLSSEERAARKATRKAEADARRTDHMGDLDAKLSPEEREARKAARKDAEVRMGDHAGDLNKDGQISPEERDAYKASRKGDAQVRREDRADDGILNGSAGDHNDHGKSVSDIAKDPTLEGREKGEAVSGEASSKARNGERDHGTHSRKPDHAGKPAGSGNHMGGKPAGSGNHSGMGKPAGGGHMGGRPAGAGH